MHRSVFSPVSSATFASLPQGEVPWLDKEGATAQDDPVFDNFPQEIQAQLLQWPENGYLVCRGFFSEEKVKEANKQIEKLLQEGETGFNYTGKKIMQAWKSSPAVKEMFTDERLRELLGFILGKRVLPFHTINFQYGSEQKAHSDAIHMATYPRGYLIAAWVTLDVVDDENGPLFFYPGSHKLPYPTNEAIGTNSHALWLDQRANDKYESYVGRQLQERGMKRENFMAQPGDVLIWHANLVHGGAPHLNEHHTRRSIAMHYFAEGVIPYHEISERPAIFEEEMLREYHQRSSPSSGGGGVA